MNEQKTDRNHNTTTGPLFLEVEIQDLKVSLELKILYILYNIHFCAPDDCGHGHMKLPVGQIK